MGDQHYKKGILEVNDSIYAYLQPDGSWGWSNAGLIVDGNDALLVDTLFDLALTREMLDAMKKTSKAAEKINTLVITHANGDHTFGNELVKDAEIISTKACAEEMAESPPQVLAQLAKAAPNLGEIGEYFTHSFGAFDFEGITLTLPTRTFEGNLELNLGDKEINLIQVGPCHTRGDLIVFIPHDRTLFAGDILFINGTPIMWAGPVDNWIRACDLMLDLDVESIVPGHGPVTDKKGVEAIKGYWEYLKKEARKRFDGGMSYTEAAMDIDLGNYGEWGDKERIAINMATLFKEFSNDTTPPNTMELFELMAKMINNRQSNKLLTP